MRGVLRAEMVQRRDQDRSPRRPRSRALHRELYRDAEFAGIQGHRRQNVAAAAPGAVPAGHPLPGHIPRRRLVVRLRHYGADREGLQDQLHRVRPEERGKVRPDQIERLLQRQGRGEEADDQGGRHARRIQDPGVSRDPEDRHRRGHRDKEAEDPGHQEAAARRQEGRGRDQAAVQLVEVPLQQGQHAEQVRLLVREAKGEHVQGSRQLGRQGRLHEQRPGDDQILGGEKVLLPVRLSGVSPDGGLVSTYLGRRVRSAHVGGRGACPCRRHDLGRTECGPRSPSAVSQRQWPRTSPAREFSDENASHETL
mmetsp:Transcript_92737/g.257900  ORF Transcript_92737/g.257900 Transcript_92737/m.257900 type:complete len:310 (-) Transcript_92737:8-937(-)